MQIIVNTIAAVAVAVAVVWIVRRAIVPAWDFFGEARDLMRAAPEHLRAVEHSSAAAARSGRIVVAASPVAMLELNAIGDCTFANGAFAALSGMPYDTTMGNGWTAVLAERVRAEVSAAMRESIRKGETFDADVLLASSGGRETPALLQCTRVGSEWLVTLTGGSR